MIDTDQFIDRYFTWLIEQAFRTKQKRSLHLGACRVLFDIPFYWTMELDADRAGDASVFRRYERHMLDQEKHNISAEWLDQWENAAPSVLEVFVGISERWYQFFEQPTQAYFIHLFYNMGFHIYRGEQLRPAQREAIVWTVDNWLARQIDRNGEGSPFPLKVNKFRVDMRTTDIWGQMNAYSHEHFLDEGVDDGFYQGRLER